MWMEELEIAEGRGRDEVLAALAKCKSFEDVRKAGILFHGTCEEIDGELRGGGYDGVFFTAKTPTVAQAYIPRSGVTSYVSKSDSWDADQAFRPTKYGGFVQRWALERAGCSIEDLEVEWNGQSAWSFTIPEGWPRNGDIDQWLEGLGYRAERSNTYEVSTRYVDGVERAMPADWFMPGQLIIALPDPSFEIRDPEWSEDALGYDTHNRVADFAAFSDRGHHAFRMEDELQSDHLGNVGHESIGVLPEGLKRLNWIAIPAIRHDGEDHSVFRQQETPEFVAFMQDLNPGYVSQAEMNVPKEDRRYTVMTDSHQPYSRAKLARMAPERSKRSGFWTETDPSAIWEMDKATAEEVKGRLGHNNPRVVRIEKARRIIASQSPALPAVESPFPEKKKELSEGLPELN